MSFLPGERVRCIDDHGGRLVLGAIYEVGDEFACDGRVIFVRGNGSDEHWVAARRFERVKKEKVDV